jgi:hypothetical protein
MHRSGAVVLLLVGLVLLVPVGLAATVESWPDGFSDGERDESILVAKNVEAAVECAPAGLLRGAPVVLAILAPVDEAARSAALRSTASPRGPPSASHRISL